MKRITAMTALLLLMIFSIAAQGTTEYTEEITETESSTEDLSVYDGLSAAEVEGLLLMREEEKLARDVYDALADIWDLRAFSNIAGSEQTHMDAVGRVLATYGIPDPITDDTPGSSPMPICSHSMMSSSKQGVSQPQRPTAWEP